MLCTTSNGMNKIIITVVIIVVAVAAVAGWWWMSRSETVSVPQTNADVEELNSIDTNQDLDAEFKAIDQDLNNL